MRGTAAQTEMVTHREYRFRSAAGLCRWRFGRGRELQGGQKAISLERDGVPRDYWRATEIQTDFALVVRCVAVARADGILSLAYGGDMSDAAIARVLHASEWQVRRVRHEALRAVEQEARRWGLMAPER